MGPIPTGPQRRAARNRGFQPRGHRPGGATHRGLTAAPATMFFHQKHQSSKCMRRRRFPDRRGAEERPTLTEPTIIGVRCRRCVMAENRTGRPALNCAQRHSLGANGAPDCKNQAFSPVGWRLGGSMWRAAARPARGPSAAARAWNSVMSGLPGQTHLKTRAGRTPAFSTRQSPTWSSIFGAL